MKQRTINITRNIICILGLLALIMVKGKDNFKTIKCRKTGKTSLHCFGEISILLSGSHLENTFSRWYLRIIFNKFTGSYKEL